MIYTFWNNKGGTGKTSLAFQAICRYAERYADQKILAIDLCPQANFSELLLGGLISNGGTNLNKLYNINGRVSVGGYFEQRLNSPFQMPSDLEVGHYISVPNKYNSYIEKNIDLLAGDRLIELQSNAIVSLSNTQVPNVNTWLKVIDWLNDFLKASENKYQAIFIDTGPSFSIYTQIALSVTDRLIIPVMADDSSRRAVQNAFSLIYGYKLPSASYDQFSFSRKMNNARRNMPLVHLIVKNRLTQYMGPATAYASILNSIDEDLADILDHHPSFFTFSNITEGLVDVRDFHTAGAVAFAEGCPFSALKPGKHDILGTATQVNSSYLDNCREALDQLVDRL